MSFFIVMFGVGFISLGVKNSITHESSPKSWRITGNLTLGLLLILLGIYLALNRL